MVVDEAGNLGEDWALPTSEDRSGNRHSIIRRYDTRTGQEMVRLLSVLCGWMQMLMLMLMLTHLPMMTMVG